MRAIAALTRDERRIVVYQGTQALRPEAGIEVLPLMQFIGKLQKGL